MATTRQSNSTIDPHWELYAGDALPGDSIMLDNEAYMITAVNTDDVRFFNIGLTLKNLDTTAWQRSQGIGIIARKFRERDVLVRTERLDFV